MSRVVDRVHAGIDAVRRRSPLADHLVRTQQHYSAVNASQQAGAVTYFGFLSFFPIMALAFFVVGWIARVYPGAQDDLRQALDDVLPHLIGDGEGQLSLTDIQHGATAAGTFGLLGVLYAGLGWLDSLRSALITVFEVTAKERPNFLVGKARDLVTLVFLGVVLMVSVVVSDLVGWLSTDVLDWIGLSLGLAWLLAALTVVVGLAASSLLFFAMFVLLAEPRTPRRSLWSGALLGAVGFEVLKQLSGLLLHSTRGQPAFQAFGISLILLVWINYFSQVTLYAAAFAHTSPAARALRGVD